MSSHDSLSVLDRQLLIQLGGRLKRLRKARGFGTVEMAKRAGVSRTTLTAVESGDPSPSMGAYLRVMSVLELSSELALLTGLTAAQPEFERPATQALVSSDGFSHRVQDLQSLALHHEAVRTIKRDPAALSKAKTTLANWIASKPDSRTTPLWQAWEQILENRSWRKVLGHTQRAQQLRSASPLPTILTKDIRLHVLSQVRDLKKGAALGDGGSKPLGD